MTKQLVEERMSIAKFYPKQLLIIAVILNSCICFGQIDEKDSLILFNHLNNVESKVDSTRDLKGGYSVLYASDSIFKSMHLKTPDLKLIELDVRYLNNYRGYVELGVDFEHFTLFKNRGQGSGNPIELFLLNKMEKRFVDEKYDYPFFIDIDRQEIVAIGNWAGKKKIIVKSFVSGKMEVYPVPKTRCNCCDCFEVIRMNTKSITLTHQSLEGERITTTIKRED